MPTKVIVNILRLGGNLLLEPKRYKTFKEFTDHPIPQ